MSLRREFAERRNPTIRSSCLPTAAAELKRETSQSTHTMSDSVRSKGVQFAEFLKTLSPEQISRGNALNLQNAADEFRRFNEHFNAGSCYLCEKPLASFSKVLPCPHWLLKPKGFKKNDVPAVADLYDFYQIQAFLRWVANHESFAKNINDLEAEGSGNKLFEVTIRWKNIEWAFACAESDYQGHATSQHSKHPHYHFQMRLDKRPFINYSDFHLPFSEMDIINIEAMRANQGKMKQRFSFGEGMNDVLSDETVEQILNRTAPSGDESDGTFKLDIIAMAEDGKTISGDDIYAIVQEAKAKGVTMASLMHKLPNARTQVIVTPGPGVVEQAPRAGRKSDA